jgi:hypothetical protein
MHVDRSRVPLHRDLQRGACTTPTMFQSMLYKPYYMHVVFLSHIALHQSYMHQPHR